MTGSNSKDKANVITELIREWVNTSPENTLQNKANDKAWDDPLVGFSRGDDPYWESFKEHVGPFHWTPAEAFMIAFPNGNIPPERLTVISWVLPQMKQTKMDTRKEKMYPPESWARGRFYGEVVNEKLRMFVVEELAESGDTGGGPFAPSQVVPDGFGSSSSLPPSGPSATPPSSRVWGPSGSPTGSSRPGGRPCGSDRLSPRWRSPRRPGPTRGTRTTACGSARGPARSAWSAVPWRPSPRRGTTRSSARGTSTRPARTISWSTSASQGYACGLCQTGVPCESKIPTPKEGE